ncbi:MAG: hypothetical protein AAB692_00930 [Patescibacteria group bacterium]
MIGLRSRPAFVSIFLAAIAIMALTYYVVAGRPDPIAPGCTEIMCGHEELLE